MASVAEPAAVLLHGIPELVTNDSAAGPGLLGIIPNAAVIIQDGHLVWVGPAGSAPAADTSVDLNGRAVLPGWVDSHTQMICARDRVDELPARLSGERSTVGAQTTVNATQAAADPKLLAVAGRHRRGMLNGGTTCANTMTGYRPTVRDQARAAATAQAAGFDDITFLGAHTVPPEYARDPDGYLDLVCGPMLDAVAPLVRWIDVACDGAFDSAQLRRVLAAGQRNGLGLRVHGVQDVTGQGVLIAVDTGAAAVAHCGQLSDANVAALVGSETIATLLPARDRTTGQPPARGRSLVDAGVRIALASGCDPDSCHTSSMNSIVALAVHLCGLTPAEAVHAATAGGARALRRDDVGALIVGARADLHVLDAPSHSYLADRPGRPLTHAVYRNGTRMA
jgi:imidazolonepropionase